MEWLLWNISSLMVALTTANDRNWLLEVMRNRYFILAVDRQHPRRPYADHECRAWSRASGHYNPRALFRRSCLLDSAGMPPAFPSEGQQEGGKVLITFSIGYFRRPIVPAQKPNGSVESCADEHKRMETAALRRAALTHIPGFIGKRETTMSRR